MRGPAWCMTVLVILIAVSGGALAADPVRRIALVTFGTTSHQELTNAFRDGLARLGYLEGQNLAIEQRTAEGQDDRLPGIVEEVLATRPEVIVVAGSRIVRAFRNRTTSVPIVVAVMGDPVGAGFIASYARPGGNVTGLAFQDGDLVTKRAELLKELVPGLTRVAVLDDPLGPAGGSRTVRDAAIRAVEALGLEPQLFDIRRVSDLPAAFAAARSAGAQAALQISSPFFSAHRQVLVEEAAGAKLPLACEQAGFVAIGCLVSYGPHFPDMYRRAAYYVDRVLRGAAPGDLPVEQPSKFELVINRRTAKLLGLTIPPSILARADEVIE